MRGSPWSLPARARRGPRLAVAGAMALVTLLLGQLRQVRRSPVKPVEPPSETVPRPPALTIALEPVPRPPAPVAPPLAPPAEAPPEPDEEPGDTPAAPSSPWLFTDVPYPFELVPDDLPERSDEVPEEPGWEPEDSPE